MTIEITPELIAICVSFVGILIGLFTLGKLVLKVGRWLQGINGRLENLESGQQQILSALQNHVSQPCPLRAATAVFSLRCNRLTRRT